MALRHRDQVPLEKVPLEKVPLEKVPLEIVPLEKVSLESLSLRGSEATVAISKRRTYFEFSTHYESAKKPVKTQSSHTCHKIGIE